ncbi:MAG: prefoldin subunit alpha [Candidatus Anstonellales archaeon]
MVELSEEQQRVLYEARVLDAQLRMLRTELDKVGLTLLDLTNSLHSVENLEVKDALVPIGGGAFVKAEISERNIIVPIGGGYLLLMDEKTAKEEVEKRIEKTKEAAEKLNDEIKKVETRLKVLLEKARGL